MNLEWMAWTPITAGFFITIFLTLVGMTVWQIVSPTIERRGWLPIKTTRGDRLFISLLISAFITIIWIGLTNWSLYLALPLYVAVTVLMIRFG